MYKSKWYIARHLVGDCRSRARSLICSNVLETAYQLSTATMAEVRNFVFLQINYDARTEIPKVACGPQHVQCIVRGVYDAELSRSPLPVKLARFSL